MKISPAPVPNQFRTSAGEVLLLKEFDIPAWDLTTDHFKDVDIGTIPNANVRGIESRIWDDNQTAFYFNLQTNDAVDTGTIWYSMNPVRPNNIRLNITVLTTDTAFDSVAINRGKLYVWYVL